MRSQRLYASTTVGMSGLEFITVLLGAATVGGAEPHGAGARNLQVESSLKKGRLGELRSGQPVFVVTDIVMPDREDNRRSPSPWRGARTHGNRVPIGASEAIS